MLFLEDFSQVSAHFQDDVTVGIEYSPILDIFLLINPTAISIWSSNLIEPEVKSTYELNEKQKECGLLMQAVFVNKTYFACLTSCGKILLFQIDSKFRISFLKTMEIASKKFFTSISTYNGFVVAGDNKGDFNLLSAESGNSNFVLALTFKLATWVIKKLSISQNYGAALCADGSVLSFKIDRKILTEEGYDLSPTVLLESGASNICSAPRSHLVAIFQPTGKFTITDGSGFSQTIERCPHITSMRFTADGKTLLAATKDGFIAWSTNCQRFRYLSNRDVTNSRCIAMSEQILLASCESGVAVIPLLIAPMSHSPLLFGSRKIIEARSTTGGSIAIQHPCDLVGDITGCAADENNRLIGVVGTHGVALFAKETANWHRPKQPDQLIKAVDFMGRTLCLIACSKRDNKYSLLLAKSSVTEELEIVKSISLPGKPVSMRASAEACAITIGKAVVLVDALFVVSIAKLSTEGTDSEPISPKQAIALLKNGKLVTVNPSTSKEDVIGLQETELMEGISSFFIDQENKIVFAHKGFAMYAAKTSDLKFIKIFESEDIPIGVNSDLFALVTIEPGSTLPLRPMLAHFFNPELTSDEKAVRAIRRSTNAHNILIQITVQMIRSGNSEKIVPFLKKFPEEYSSVLVAALRTSEPPERAGIIKVLGSATEIFAQLANANFVQKKIPQFFRSEAFDVKSLRNASLLLEVVMQEDGPISALACSLFVAENSDAITDDLYRAINMFSIAVSELKEHPDGIDDLIERAKKITPPTSTNEEEEKGKEINNE